MAIVDDLHQVATLLGGKPGHGPIVDYEQLYPGELGEQPGGLAVDAGELVEKPSKPLIAHREPATRGLVADGASQETLAATGRAQDQNIVVLVQPAAAGEAGARHQRHGQRSGQCRERRRRVPRLDRAADRATARLSY